jgi:hypothetical protein
MEEARLGQRKSRWKTSIGVDAQSGEGKRPEANKKSPQIEKEIKSIKAKEPCPKRARKYLKSSENIEIQRNPKRHKTGVLQGKSSIFYALAFVDASYTR